MHKKYLKGLLTSCLIISSILGAHSSEAASVDSAAAYYLKGKDFQSLRQYGSAWKFFEKAATANPQNEQYQLAIAEVCEQMHRMGPYVKALEQAALLKPNNYSTQAKLVKLYFDFGQFGKVIEKLPGIQQQVPKLSAASWMMGRSYYATQNYGQAIRYLKLAIKDEPKNSEAPYFIGRILVKEENYKAAIPYYEMALQLDTQKQANRVYELALICATALQPELSIKYFQQALDLNYKPSDEFYINMANTLADAKKFDEALKLLNGMLDRRPGDIGLLNTLADICYHGGRYKESIKYLDELLKMDDKNARALYKIGTAYIKMGKDVDGKKLCDAAIALDPSLEVLKHAKQMM